MTTNRCAHHDDRESRQIAERASPAGTAALLYGWRPLADEPDPRPLPDANRLKGAALRRCVRRAGQLDAPADTRLEPDLPDLLWSLVNLFHRRIDRINAR